MGEIPSYFPPRDRDEPNQSLGMYGDMQPTAQYNDVGVSKHGEYL